MGNRKLLRQMISAVVILLALVSCSGPATATPIPATPTPFPPTATPTPVPPLSFRGKLIVNSPAGVFVLISDPANGEIKEIQLSKDNHNEATISPNDRYLLFANSGSTTTFTLVDLSSLESTTLFAGPEPTAILCFGWAPASTRFSYVKENSLYTYDITTQDTEFIFKAPLASYEGYTGEFYGQLYCGHWIGEDRLLFERFVGPMPSQITLPSQEELRPNKTTLALINNGTKLIDSPELFFVRYVSKDGSYILIRKEDGEYIANSFRDFADIKLRSIESPGQWVDFMNSNEVIMSDESVVSIVDPETLKIRKSFTVPFDWQNSDFPFQLGVWVGEPSEGIFIWAIQNHIYMGDFNTGLKTRLWDATDDHLHLLDWVP